MEATVDVRIRELAPHHHGDNGGGGGGGGIDLSVSGHVAKIAEEIKLFRGVVAGWSLPVPFGSCIRRFPQP